MRSFIAESGSRTTKRVLENNQLAALERMNHYRDIALEWKRLAQELAEAVLMGGVKPTTRTLKAIQAIECASDDQGPSEGGDT